MPDVSHFLFGLLGIGALVFANGFFVAAEFAIVTVRKTRVDQLIAEGNRTARVVRRALSDPDSYIAATQLGITMTSLGLGWIGEPALAAVLEPGLAALVGDRVAVATSHSAAFTIAFAIITALHIVLGELAPRLVFANAAEWDACGLDWTDVPFDVVVKGGADGAVTVVGGVVMEHAAMLTDVVDLTGAGDALAAGYLVGGIQLGLSAAARCVSQHGAQPADPAPRPRGRPARCGRR